MQRFSRPLCLLLLSLGVVGAVILITSLLVRHARISASIGCEKALAAALKTESTRSDSQLIQLATDTAGTNGWYALSSERYDAAIALLLQEGYELDPPDRSPPGGLLLDPWGRRFEILVRRFPDHPGIAFRVMLSNESRRKAGLPAHVEQ